MLKKIWSWVKSLFTKENIGIIWRTLFTSSKSAIANLISDATVQAKAYEIAKSLMSDDLTSDEKKTAFNAQMLEWLKTIGKEVGDSTLSTLRELAVSSCKVEDEEAEG